MNKEEQRLLTMFQKNKISESDYQMLHKALNKKTFCTILKDSVLINPFKKIAGFKALFLGLILAVLISLIGVYANIFIDGSLGYLMPKSISKQL